MHALRRPSSATPDPSTVLPLANKPPRRRKSSVAAEVAEVEDFSAVLVGGSTPPSSEAREKLAQVAELKRGHSMELDISQCSVRVAAAWNIADAAALLARRWHGSEFAWLWASHALSCYAPTLRSTMLR